MIKEAIVKIVNKEDLTYDEAYTVINEIMSGETTATQNAAFLAALSTNCLLYTSQGKIMERVFWESWRIMKRTRLSSGKMSV